MQVHAVWRLSQAVREARQSDSVRNIRTGDMRAGVHGRMLVYLKMCEKSVPN